MRFAVVSGLSVKKKQDVHSYMTNGMEWALQVEHPLQDYGRIQPNPLCERMKRKVSDLLLDPSKKELE